METIHLNFEDKEFTVSFDVQRYEPQTRDHPGCESSVDVIEIFYGDEDWTDFIFAYIGEDRVTEMIYEHFTDYYEH